MSGGGGSLIAKLAPMALMAIPGVGTALSPLLAGMGMTAGAATDAISTGLMGALTSGGISALTGSKNPLESALIGGLGAGIGSYALSGSGAAASDAVPTPTPTSVGEAFSGSPLSAVKSANSLYAADFPGGDPTSAMSLGASKSLLGSAGNDALSAASPSAYDIPIPQGGFLGQSAMNAAPSATPQTSMLGGIGNYIKENPLKAAIIGSMGLAGVQSLMPQKKVNTAQNRADVLASDPGFNSQLPAYHMQNTASPYTGDWYKYGMTPQQPMYQSQVVPGYAHGGMVKGYAAGGMPSMPQAAPPMPSQAMAAQGGIPVNPLTIKTAFNVGHAIGKSLKHASGNGMVHGHGGGQDDLVPARLSQNEYVIPADVTAHLGDGSSNAGGKALDKLVKNVRAHKTSKGTQFPPKAKNPLSYIGRA